MKLNVMIFTLANQLIALFARPASSAKSLDVVLLIKTIFFNFLLLQE